jgi:hypothetical protein
MSSSSVAATGTTYALDFDFTSADQKANLDYLQANNYQLLAYKGATGPNQVTAGVPVWFAEPFKNMFGTVEIDYQPQYKVYVYNQATIGANTTIKMEVLSDVLGLGHSLIFNQDGSFSPGTASAPAGSIVLQNNTQSGTPTVTVGLAALINGEYLPFCAFTSTPQSSVAMTPQESACLFAAQTALVSGSVTAVATAPGCSLSFSGSQLTYNFAIMDSTYAVYGIDSTNTTPVSSGQDLSLVLNS